MKIDGFEYSGDLYWDNEFVTPGRASSSRQTMGVGGCTIRQELITDIKGDIELVAEDAGDSYVGWWEREQLLYLRAAEISGRVLSLDYEGQIFSARVAPGGLAGAVAVRKRPNAVGKDKYYGKVIFQKV